MKKIKDIIKNPKPVKAEPAIITDPEEAALLEEARKG